MIVITSEEMVRLTARAETHSQIQEVTLRHVITAGLVLLAGCQPSRPRQADTAATGTQAGAVSHAERQAVEDTIRKLNDVSVAAQNRRDLDGLMQIMPESDMLAVSDGMMFTSADSVRTALQGFWSAPWLKSLKLTSKVERIDILSPTAAVMTTTSTTEVDSAGKQMIAHNLWTGVWQNRQGSWVVIQQHSSSVPSGT